MNIRFIYTLILFFTLVSNASFAQSCVTFFGQAGIPPGGINYLFCSGVGSTTLNATATQGNPTAYNWSNGGVGPIITVLAPGTYTVTISQGGNPNACILTFTVSPANPINPNAGNDTIVCPGDSVIFGANLNYNSYSWSTGDTTPSITASNPGQYIVQVTDANNCTASDTVVLSNFTPAVPAIGTSANSPFCPNPGNNLTLPAPFSNPIWNTGDTTQTINVDTTGTYTVTANDANGCLTTGTISVTSRPKIWPNLPDTVLRCTSADTFLFAGGAGFSSFLWSTGAQTNSIIATLDGVYWVNTVDVNGCTGTDTTVVSTFTTNTADLGNDTAICNGEFVTLNPGVYNSYQWNGFNFSPTVMAHQQGMYSVTVVDSNGCTSMDSMFLTVYDLVPFSITGNAPVCPGDTQVLKSQNYFSSYLWSTGDTIDSIFVHIPGNYILNVTDTNGCLYAASVNFQNHALPNVNLGANDTLCIGQNKILNAGAGFITYDWTPAFSSQIRTVTSTNTYSVTVVDNNGCVASDTVFVYFDPGPTVSLGPDVYFCIGDSASLSTNPTYNTYNWSTGASSPSITVSQQGQYSVTITDSITGCTGRDTLQVFTYNLPNVNIGSDIFYCQNTSFTQILNPGPGFTTYTWMDGSSNQLLTVNQNIDTVWLVVSDVNGCINSDTLYIFENPLPNLNLGPDDSLCSGQSRTINAGTSGGTITNYAWNTGQTSQNRTYQAPLNVLTPTSTTWSVTVTDLNGCQRSDTITLTALPNPTPYLGRDTAYCVGSPFNLTLNPGSYSAYLWNDGSTNNSLAIFAFDSLYSVTVTDTNGCSGEATFAVRENPLPVPNLGPDTAYCEGFPFVKVLSPGGFYAYNWSDGSTNAVKLINSAGSYSVTVIDANGCVNDDDINVIMYTRPRVNLGNNIVLCEDSIFSITLDASTMAPPIGINYNWNTGQNTPSIQATNFGSYSVTISETMNGCSDSSRIQINPFGILRPDLGPDTTICEGEAIVLNPNINGEGYSFLWSNGATSRTTIIDQAGTYWVELNAINGTCKGIRDTIQFVLGTIPIVELGDEIIACEGTQVKLLDNRTAYPNARYYWQDTIPGAEFTVTRTGYYRVKATNNCGTATDEIFVKFDDCENIYVPNTFTPNGDNRNDFFFAQTATELIEFSMIIYDRWGNTVFKTSDILAKWDGTYNGTELPIGVYTYQIAWISAFDPNVERKEKIGRVNLLR